MPTAEIWIAEFDIPCLEKAKREGKVSGAHILTGDQDKPEDIARWVSESGGKFDVVVDDGGHSNSHILKF